MALMAIIYSFISTGNKITAESFIFQIMYFLKIISANQQISRIETLFVTSKTRQYIYDIIKLILTIMVYCHFVSILQHSLAKYEDNNSKYDNDNWFIQYGLVDPNWLDLYCYSFYWSLSTMMLIGSSPNNTLEMIFTSFVILITVGIFAYTINQIGNILNDINLRKKEFRDEMNIINKHMRRKNTSPVLQQKVRSYLEFHNKNHENIQINNESQRILLQLPFDLQEQVALEKTKNILIQFPNLKKIFSKTVLDQLILFMKERLYIEGETIFKQNQYEGVALYLIAEGHIDLMLSRDDKIHSDQQHQSVQEILIKTCKKGEIFGTTGPIHEFTARCSKTCTVYQIMKSDLDYCLRQETEDIQKFKQIQDKLINCNEIYRVINQRCLICKSFSHNENQCTLVHFQPSLMNLLKNVKPLIQTDRVKSFKRSQEDNGVQLFSSTFRTNLSNKTNNNFMKNLDTVNQQFLFSENDLLNSQQSESQNTNILDEQDSFDSQQIRVQKFRQKINQDCFLNKNTFVQKICALKQVNKLYFLARKLSKNYKENDKTYVNINYYQKWEQYYLKYNKIEDQYYQEADKSLFYYWIWLKEYLKQQNLVAQLEEFDENKSDSNLSLNSLNNLDESDFQQNFNAYSIKNEREIGKNVESKSLAFLKSRTTINYKNQLESSEDESFTELNQMIANQKNKGSANTNTLEQNKNDVRSSQQSFIDEGIAKNQIKQFKIRSQIVNQQKCNNKNIQQKVRVSHSLPDKRKKFGNFIKDVDILQKNEDIIKEQDNKNYYISSNLNNPIITIRQASSSLESSYKGQTVQNSIQTTKIKKSSINCLDNNIYNKYDSNNNYNKSSAQVKNQENICQNKHQRQRILSQDIEETQELSQSEQGFNVPYYNLSDKNQKILAEFPGVWNLSQKNITSRQIKQKKYYQEKPKQIQGQNIISKGVNQFYETNDNSFKQKNLERPMDGK